MTAILPLLGGTAMGYRVVTHEELVSLTRS